MATKHRPTSQREDFSWTDSLAVADATPLTARSQFNFPRNAVSTHPSSDAIRQATEIVHDMICKRVLEAIRSWCCAQGQQVHPALYRVVRAFLTADPEEFGCRGPSATLLAVDSELDRTGGADDVEPAMDQLRCFLASLDDPDAFWDSLESEE